MLILQIKKYSCQLLLGICSMFTRPGEVVIHHHSSWISKSFLQVEVVALFFVVLLFDFWLPKTDMVMVHFALSYVTFLFSQTDIWMAIMESYRRKKVVKSRRCRACSCKPPLLDGEPCFSHYRTWETCISKACTSAIH